MRFYPDIDPMQIMRGTLWPNAASSVQTVAHLQRPQIGTEFRGLRVCRGVR